MESNSYPGRIMCSQKTADLLISSGYKHWLRQRSELVAIKGKGEMQCYWCHPYTNDTSANRRESLTSDHSATLLLSRKGQVQLIQWVADMLQGILREVVVRRLIINSTKTDPDTALFDSMVFSCPRDEVSETITIRNALDETANSSSFFHDELPKAVVSQLMDYISTIASLYQNNPFHNFEHAAHVVMASNKLLKRVVKPIKTHSPATAYGITSDPLTQFAILFSALIHDVDHPGVSNAQLVNEHSPVATLYHNKSVAEQNSVTISWDLLMKTQFSDLRLAIMPTIDECKRFRQLVVNAVLATDLFDADLKSFRENRWKKAFDRNEVENQILLSSSLSASILADHSNRRATIVIEHIIQAADVSHTMQHWHVYQKWNQRLFEEMYQAYTDGRSDKDPSIDWYNGELWFFDNYVIPLAMKLKTCEVFGVSCDELLDYAKANRAEWASKGEEIVLNNINKIKSKCVLDKGTAVNTIVKQS
jgi:3'5'-cyclic nucleotide phosphodiesterase